MTELPEGWRTLSLNNVAHGGLFTDGNWVETKDQDPQGSVRLTQLADVGVGKFRDRSSRWLREDQAAGLRCTFLKPSDVLIARMPDPIGRACLVPEGIGRAITAVDVAVLRIADPEILPRYVMWAVNDPKFHAAVESLQSGTTRKRISRKNLAALAVPIPDAREQRRIVDILEGHLSRLDGAEGFLTAARRRSQQLRSVALESLSPPGAPWRTLAQLCVDSGYGTSTKCVAGGLGAPVVRIPNLTDGRVDLTDEKRAVESAVDLSRFMLEAEDLLVVRTNGSRDLIGRAAVVQSGIVASFASYLIRFKIDPSQARPQWVRVMLGTPSSRRVLESMAASSAGQYNLGLKKLNSVLIPCPPLEEQDRLLAKLDGNERAHTSLTRSLDTAGKRAYALRRTLLAAAFSGRLTARSSDMELAREMAGV